MTYAIKLKRETGTYFCYIINGILNQTAVDLAEKYPHLVRRWKTAAAAKGVLTRILKAYPNDRRFGTAANYTIVEMPE